MALPAPDRRTFLTALIAAVAGAGVVGACSVDDDGGVLGDPDPDDVDRTHDHVARRPRTSRRSLHPGRGLRRPAARLGDPVDPPGHRPEPRPTAPAGWAPTMSRSAGESPPTSSFDRRGGRGHRPSRRPRWGTRSTSTPTGSIPTRWYYYRFSVGDRTWTSPVGRTRTMPADDASPESFASPSPPVRTTRAGYYAAYRAMAADELDLRLLPRRLHLRVRPGRDRHRGTVRRRTRSR